MSIAAASEFRSEVFPDMLLGQQIERLTEAYLGAVIPLPEYQRWRQDLEQKRAAFATQEVQLTAQVDRQVELGALKLSMEAFCQRVRVGLDQATFEQKRELVELLIDRVIVANGDVEIRYVIPTSPSGEHIRFCHLRSDYLDHPALPPGPTRSSSTSIPGLATRLETR